MQGNIKKGSAGKLACTGYMKPFDRGLPKEILNGQCASGA